MLYRGAWARWNRRKTWQRLLGLLLGLLLVTLVLPSLAQDNLRGTQQDLVQQNPVQQNPDQHSSGMTARQLAEQGHGQYLQGDLLAAIATLTQATEQFEAQMDGQALAGTLTNLGRVQFAAGQFQPALDSLEQAVLIYRNDLDDELGVMRNRIYQAQIQQALGLYPKACETLTQALVGQSQLCTAVTLTDEGVASLPLPDPHLLPDPHPLPDQHLIPDQYLPNSVLLMGWQAFADNLRVMGRLDESRRLLIRLSKTDSSPTVFPEQASILLSLGNTWQAIGDRERDRLSPQQFDAIPWRCEAIDSDQPRLPELRVPYQTADDIYQQALKASTSASLSTKAQLNRLQLATQLHQREHAQVWVSADLDLDQLPPGQERIYAQIQAAQSRACLKQQLGENLDWESLRQQLQAAIQTAQTMGDPRAASYGLGYLGGLYEYQAHQLAQRGQPVGELQQTAIALTDQALYQAHSVQAADIYYRWQWQRGRLLKAKGERPAAIAAYKSAVDTLGAVRADLLTVNSDIQFSFRDHVEPIYRELVALLLAGQADQPNQATLQALLGDTLYYVESLQLAELENFLRCTVESLNLDTVERFSTQPSPASALRSQIDRIFQDDPTATFVYPILLKDHIAVILKQPGQPFRYEVTDVPHQTVEDTLGTLQIALRNLSRTKDIQVSAGHIYDWIIRPFELDLETDIDLEQSSVQTLVFVLDGELRNIPMSVLYDSQRQRYLLERYAIALSSGLQLIADQQPAEPVRALVTGLSQARTFGEESFSALANVPAETQAIQSVIPSQLLLDEAFVRQNLQTQLTTADYAVVHMATHGHFSSDPEQTYVVLYDEQLDARGLETLLRSNRDQSIALLVLSACETATGDKRATLGLAGIAIRSGASSTLATLWQVNDESTAEFMALFYQRLHEQPQLSKAEALRQVQLELWKNEGLDWDVPFFWAPYVLVGNWL